METVKAERAAACSGEAVGNALKGRSEMETAALSAGCVRFVGD